MKYTLKIDGMYCSMCESHVNDAIRNNFQIKKVKSKHKTGDVLIETNTPLDTEKLTNTLNSTGYKVLDLKEEA